MNEKDPKLQNDGDLSKDATVIRDETFVGDSQQLVLGFI